MENLSYIKLFRKLLKSPIFENEKALKIWIWCLLKASHNERKQLVGQQIIDIKKGEFVFGRNRASEELKMTESTIYKYIKLLEKLQMISIKSNNKFSVISIEKWEDYQVEELKNNIKITTEEQQSNTNKNVKNIKNVKNNNIPASEEKSSSAYAKASKHKYGEYKNVLLKDKELQSLQREYENWKELITYLDEYIEMKGYKAKSHYLCIKKWVVDAVKRENNKQEIINMNNKNTDWLKEELESEN